jgi:hypothetical protein
MTYALVKTLFNQLVCLTLNEEVDHGTKSRRLPMIMFDLERGSENSLASRNPWGGISMRKFEFTRPIGNRWLLSNKKDPTGQHNSPL